MIQKKINFNWPRVLLSVLFFCIIFIIVYFAIFYRSIESSRTDGYDEATSFVLNNSQITDVENVNYFQAEEGFFTFSATNKAEESFFVFLRDDEPLSKEHLYVVPKSELISIEQLESELLQECSDCTLISSTPAMIDELPLWELTYTDEANRYVIDYKYLENGKTFEKLRLTRKYKKD